MRIAAWVVSSETNYEDVVMTNLRTWAPVLFSAQVLRAVLVGVLGVAAALHLWLTPAHFEESTLMGMGFLAAAGVEFGLALAVLLRPMRLVYISVIAVAIALIGLYAYNVAVGLPFGSHPASTAADDHHASERAGDGGESHEQGAITGSGHHDDGLVVGSGEPIDAPGAATKLTEIAALGLAIALLWRRPGSGP